MGNSRDEKARPELSRRTFFGASGTFLAGVAVTAAGCSALASKKQNAANEVAAKWPLPYTKLDVEDVRKRGYAGYYKGR